MSDSTDLDALLAQARDAEPSDRINLRDAVAAHGETAVDAMIDWVSDRAERCAADGGSASEAFD